MLHPNLELSRPRLMAIVNATPDSFSDGGLLYQEKRVNRDKVLSRLHVIAQEGADIIDVGGESTRPGAVPVSEQEELDRVIPIIECAIQETDLAVSVDTSSPKVMLEAAASGAHLINDVRALSRDGAVEAAVKSQLHVCLMHMQGVPANMQLAPNYQQVVTDVADYLCGRISSCVEKGVSKNKIWVDPGFGFGKTLTHNLSLLGHLPSLAHLDCPVLVGLSRKSLIKDLLGRELSERLPASLALALMSLERGAQILRVHDVKAARDIIDVFFAVTNHSR